MNANSAHAPTGRDRHRQTRRRYISLLDERGRFDELEHSFAPYLANEAANLRGLR